MKRLRWKSTRWQGVDFMALIPVRACGWVEADAPGRVVVLQPRYGTGLLGRFLQPRLTESKKYLRIPLEERGSYLWKLIDGTRTAGDLAAAFSEAFPEDVQQVPERVAAYLYQMSENKLIDYANLPAR